MNREEMTRRLQEDLARIPRGGLRQNILRSTYNMQRESDLRRDPLAPKAASLKEAIRLVRNDDPSFEATFDSAYFSK